MDQARKVQTGLHQGTQTLRKTLGALRVSSCAFQYTLPPVPRAQHMVSGMEFGADTSPSEGTET